jgi:uncharacterized protein YbaP (TraB family)
MGMAASAQEEGRHFMWQVTAPGGATAYLLGSVHVMNQGVYPLSPAIEKAFKESKVLVEEVDLDEMNNPATMIQLMAKAMLPENQTLDMIVSPETFEAVRARAAAGNVPLVVLQRMKPWTAGVTLAAAELTRAGFNSNLGIDKHFFDRAKEAGMPFRPLETLEYQFDRLDGLPGALQEKSLEVMLADIDSQVSNVETIIAAWRKGDTSALEKLMAEGTDEAPEIRERLLVERNRNWIPHIEKCLKTDEKCFVVVGAAHLVGPDSVVDLLQKAGYKVEQQ